MPLYSVDAIVLRRREFEETGKLLTIFTREQGKYNAVAKGSRRPQSRLVGSTEPLVHARMQLAEGRNLDIITEATLKHAFTTLKTSAETIAAGLYIAELTDALVDERQWAPDLFDLLLSSLHLIESRNAPEIVLRRFEMQALDIAGYSPETQRCLKCRAPRPTGRSASYSAQMGGIICTRCRGGEMPVVLVKGETLDAMNALRDLPAHKIPEIDLSSAAMNAMADVVASHMEVHLEHRLKSRSVTLSPPC